MTYLQLVNGILARLREDTVDSLAGQDDVVVEIVKQLVNDAKHSVEEAHQWNALRTEYSVTTVAGTDTYTIAGSAGTYSLDQMLKDDGVEVINMQTKALRKRQQGATGTGNPQYYSVCGADSSGNLKVRFSPTPDAAYDFTVCGFQAQDPLSADTDIILVPSQPVLYLALALATRERGEVGGQTAAEIFNMADAYLSDAIARDASLNPLDDIWMTV